MAYLKKVKSGYYKYESHRENRKIKTKYLGKASVLDFAPEKSLTIKEKIGWFLIKLLYKMRLVR